jgi:GNAT superfamily N-acetyltransferase
MFNDLSVRSVARQDYDPWLSLWDGYNAFYGRSGDIALSPEITQTTWARFFDAYEPVHALVAEQDGQLVGLPITSSIAARRHSARTATYRICSQARLRGAGGGRALINAVCERAKDAGSPRVYWQTHETNQTARELYDKVAEHSGFVVYRKLF